MKILMNISFATGYLISMFVHLLFIPLTWQSFGGAFLGIALLEFGLQLFAKKDKGVK